MKARLHRLDSHYVLCQVLAIFVRYVQVAIVEGFVEKRPLRLYRWIRMSTLFHAGFQSAALAIPCGEEGRFVSSFSWLFSLSYWFHSGISVATRTSLLSYPSWFLFFCLTGSDCSSSFIGYTEFIVFTHLGAEGWFRSSFGSVGTLAVVSDRLYIRVAACATCSSSSSSTSWTRRPARSQKETSLETQDCGLVVT